jgi:malyl-CoA/(S)-citramalyl-CoA lyase
MTSNDLIRLTLSRSLLSVPVNNPRFVEKAFGSAADIIMLDLEDSVAPSEKADARVELLRILERPARAKYPIVAVRVNAPSSPAHQDDVLCLVAAKHKPDLVVVPKVERASDLGDITQALNQCVAFDAMIESPRALHNLADIIQGVNGLSGIHFGPGDFAAAMGIRMATIGGEAPNFGLLVAGKDGQRSFQPLDVFQPVQFQMTLMARTFGIRVMDGPYAMYRDNEGLAAASLRAAALGMDGKWAIHPDQIATINAAFTPADSAVKEAHEILAALSGSSIGAAQFKGRMIDEASVRQAKAVIFKADMIRQRTAFPLLP